MDCSSIGFDNQCRSVVYLFSSLCISLLLGLYVFLLITLIYLSLLACIKFALRICVGDYLGFLLYVRDLSFARDRLLRFLPRIVIC